MASKSDRLQHCSLWESGCFASNVYMSILSVTFKVKVYIVLFGVKLPRRIISRTNYLHSIVILILLKTGMG